jgi:hypothetical protein
MDASFYLSHITGRLYQKKGEREKEIIMWKLTVAQLVKKFSTIYRA